MTMLRRPRFRALCDRLAKWEYDLERREGRERLATGVPPAKPKARAVPPGKVRVKSHLRRLPR